MVCFRAALIATEAHLDGLGLCDAATLYFRAMIALAVVTTLPAAVHCFAGGFGITWALNGTLYPDFQHQISYNIIKLPYQSASNMVCVCGEARFPS